MLNVGVVVSGGGTNLQNIIDGARAGKLPVRVVSVVSTNPDAFALKRAEAAGIPAVVMRRKDYGEYGEALARHFSEAGAGLIVLAGCTAVLDEKFIKAFRGRIINVHPSLLPAFGGRGMFGLNVHKAAIAAGVKVSGATVHFVTENVDAGPIITQKTAAVYDGDTPESLRARVMEEAERIALPEAVKLFAQGRVALENGATKRIKHVLVIGGGGREHAICRKLSESPGVGRLYCAPGNAGIAEIAEIVPTGADETEELVNFATSAGVDMAVIGPDGPLAAGLADMMEAAGVPAFGPRKAAARLEYSKLFAKEFMARHGIPTAKHAAFDDYGKALGYIESGALPVVIKADGLALGKGVFVCAAIEEARAALAALFVEKRFGEAGSSVVIEECLRGREVSVLAFCDGGTIKAMPAARDYKRAYDGGEGPNTGGMGAISPAPGFTEELLRRCEREIFRPTLEGLKKEGIVYKGVIYFGLMITDEGPKVIEYNARFGDPEAQAVLSLLETDIMELFTACICSNLGEIDIKWKTGSAVCVVLASGGYPGEIKTGREIHAPGHMPEGAVAFHAGTKISGGKTVTSGGRVIGVTASARTPEEAKDAAYAAARLFSFEGMRMRGDIGS